MQPSTLMQNPYVRAFVGGFASALTVAGPLVDDGFLASEVIAVCLAFLTGTGLTAVPGARSAGRHRADA